MMIHDSYEHLLWSKRPARVQIESQKIKKLNRFKINGLEMEQLKISIRD